MGNFEEGMRGGRERLVMLREQLDKKEKENKLVEEELEKVGFCGFVDKMEKENELLD